jgi:hypothetical protein
MDKLLADGADHGYGALRDPDRYQDYGAVTSAYPRRPAAARSIRDQHQAHHLRRDELLGPELPVNGGIHEHPPGRVCSRTGRR